MFTNLVIQVYTTIYYLMFLIDIVIFLYVYT